MSEWKLVPVEPTEEMIAAAMQAHEDKPLTDWGKIVPANDDEIYRAMLAAAPIAPAQSEPVAWMLENQYESTRWYTSGRQAMKHWVSKGAIATPLYAAPAVFADDARDALRCLQRYEESSGEGGGVYENEEGDFIRLSDALAAIDASLATPGATNETNLSS